VSVRRVLRLLLAVGVAAAGFAVVWWIAETWGGLDRASALVLAGFAGSLLITLFVPWATGPIKPGPLHQDTADKDGIPGPAFGPAAVESAPPTNKRRRRMRGAAVLATAALAGVAIVVVVSSFGENGQGRGGAQAAPDYPFAPPGIVVSPDGQWLYVTLNYSVLGSDGWTWGGALVAIDAQTRVIGNSFVFAPGAGHGVITPDGKQMYIALDYNGVANILKLGANPVGIGGFDLPGQPSATAPPGAGGTTAGHPRMALGPDGHSLYIADPGTTFVWPANAQERSVGTAIKLDKPPLDIVISPDGKRLYAAVAGGEIVTIDTDTGTVSNRFADLIVVGADPRAIAISRDGTRLYVANHGSDTVSAIDTGTGTVVRQFPPGCGTKPVAVAVGRDANRVYVTCESSNTVAAMDGQTGTTVGTPVQVGLRPSSMAVSPDGTRLYVTTVEATTINVAAIDTATNTLAVPAFPAATW